MTELFAKNQQSSFKRVEIWTEWLISKVRTFRRDEKYFLRDDKESFREDPFSDSNNGLIKSHKRGWGVNVESCFRVKFKLKERKS